MTQNHDFKQLVRERMKRTGERYTAARAMILGASERPAAAAVPGLLAGYTSFGGVCRDTGALRNVLAAAGVKAPHTGRAPSEALVAGLCGGVGFLYAVFEYKGFPPMISVMCRFDTMPDGYVAGGLERLGVRAEVSETGSPAAARKALDAALAAGRPALCVVDVTALAPPGGTRSMMAGMAPTVVAVAGTDGGDLLVDDGGLVPRRMTFDEFAGARALYKKGRNRLVTLEPGQTPAFAAAVRGAVAATADRYVHAPYKGFASNFGFAGIEKWQRLLTDAKDKKGWPALFPEGRLAYLALRRAHDGIEHEFTAPGAGRPLYAEFLGEAAAITGDARFAAAAAHYRRAGEAWRAISGAIASCGDAAVEKGCTLGDSAREMFDLADCARAKEAAAIDQERTALAETCRLTRPASAAIYADLASKVGAVLALEREAVAALQAAAAS